MSRHSRSVARSGFDGQRKDKRLAFRFTDERNIQFVELYGREPCLWNQRPYLTSSRNAAYKRIQAGVNAHVKGVEAPLSLTDIKIKITELHRQYNQELRKMNSNRNYTPRASWFEPLHAFLAEYSDKDSNRSSSPQLKKLKIRLTRLKSMPVPSRLKVEPQGVLVAMHEPKRSVFTTLPAPMAQIPAISHPAVSSPVQQFADISSNVKIGQREEGRVEDEFTYFGLSVAAQLRNMPLESAMVMQSKIQYLLSTERRKITGHTTEMNIFN